MPSILNEKKFQRLDKSIDWSIKQLAFPRRKRIEAVKQFCGSHFAEGGAEKKVPVPFLALAVMVYIRQLAAKAPKAMFSSIYDRLRPVAATMEIVINKIPEEIKLGNTLRKMVAEALFSPWGVVKCGLHTVGTALGHSYGESFVDLVTFDDFFIDMSAKLGDDIDYEGNDYWLDYDELMEFKEMDREARRFIKPDDRTYIGPNGESRSDSMTTPSTAETYKDKVWVRDVWIPDEKLLVTYGITSKRILFDKKLDGPPRGPYHKLSFIDVVGENQGLPPVALWRDLHDLANALFRKLAVQADGQKTVLGFDGSDDQGVADFKKAKDGDGIKYSGREPKKLEAGGVNRETLAFEMHCRDLFNYFAWNIDSLGGLAPLTDTVGQDKLIGDAASVQVKDMADRVSSVSEDIFTALAYYEWNDPIKRRRIQKPIPGTDMSIEVDFGRESKLGDFDMYDLAIDMYSFQEESPSTKLQKLGLITKEYVLPLAELIQQTGGIINTQKIFELIGKFANFPEIAEIVTFADNLGIQEDTGQAGGMPAHTTREYVRRGAPGQTKQGASAVMQELLLGGGAQSAELPS